MKNLDYRKHIELLDNKEYVEFRTFVIWKFWFTFEGWKLRYIVRDKT